MEKRDDKGRFIVGTKPGPGRDSTYDPDWMDDQAYRLALLGLTDDEIATAFGIASDTFYRWKRDHVTFAEALNRGGTRADAEVAHSLYQRATGMVVSREKALKGEQGKVVVAQTKTEIAPDVKAAAHWLALRQRKKWSQPKEGEEDPFNPDETSPETLRQMSKADLAARIAQLERRRKAEEETDE